jgi:glycosyltransferase involved in cell wall biosynthesis
MKILHVITALGNGGAEALLYRLCVNDRSNTHVIISLKSNGKYQSKLESINIQQFSLDIKSPLSLVEGLLRLRALIVSIDPNVVQSWLYHGDLFASLATLGQTVDLIWSVHNCHLGPFSKTLSLRIVLLLLGCLSWISPRCIIFCSRKALILHRKWNYNPKICMHIPNGVDVHEFYPSILSDAPRLLSAKPVLCCVSRDHPVKDIPNLIEALALLHERQISFTCLFVGSNLDENNHDLARLIHAKNLREHCKLIGPVEDVPALLRSIDIFVLPSKSEAFPNVILESMSCGVPCVATDVGDIKQIIGECGWVVPPANPTLLAASIESAIISFYSPAWPALRLKNRERIASSYNIDGMIQCYNKVWSDLCR